MIPSYFPFLSNDFLTDRRHLSILLVLTFLHLIMFCLLYLQVCSWQWFPRVCKEALLGYQPWHQSMSRERRKPENWGAIKDFETGHSRSQQVSTSLPDKYFDTCTWHRPHCATAVKTNNVTLRFWYLWNPLKFDLWSLWKISTPFRLRLLHIKLSGHESR